MSWDDKKRKMEERHKFGKWEFDYNSLKNTEDVIVYTDSSHLDRKLVKNKDTGTLFLYEFYEYVNFNGGNDQMYETYTLVTDEEDANKLNQEGNIKRHPFIFVNDDFSISVN
jgi:hypothetical protein